MADHPSKTPGSRSKKKQRERYWSLMLVGDQGRIIPFKRFKGIAIGFIVILILALTALTVLSLLYWRQAETITGLQERLAQLKQQTDQLRDEKDVLLARLVIEEKIPVEETPSTKAVDEDEDDEQKDLSAGEIAGDRSQAENRSNSQNPEPIQQAAPNTETEPEVKLGARIERFEVTYHSNQSILQAQFRIYNDSQPKEPLSGRVVVVFKQEDDPPLKWITVPRVQMVHGVPDGRRGKIFRIRNYRTMTLKAYGLKPPIRYNVAGVYVYSAEGDLILNQEFGFAIEPPPEPKPQEKDEARESEPTAKPSEGKSTAEASSQSGQQSTEPSTAGDTVKGPSANTQIYAYPDPYGIQSTESVQDQAGDENTESDVEQEASSSEDVPESDMPSKKVTP